MKIIGILVEVADGTQQVVANTRLVSASDPRLAEPIPWDRLGTRSANAFREAGITTFGDIFRRSRAEIERTPDIGRKAMNGLSELMYERDLHFNTVVLEVA